MQKKLDVNAGIGDDFLGILLGQFSYPYNNAGNTSLYQVRAIGAIPDRKFNQYDNGNTTTYEHQFLYLPIQGEDGKIWLSNNLGAHYADINHSSFNLTQQATSQSDYLAYGSAFQWGRKPDGHELNTHTSGTTGTAVYGTTSTKIDNPTDALFITNSTTPHDWRITPDGALWANETSANNPCPVGFKVPTISDITDLKTAAAITDISTAASSVLKLSASAVRQGHNAVVASGGAAGFYWSRSTDVSNSAYVYRFWTAPNTKSIATFRVTGYSVRCIKN